MRAPSAVELGEAIEAALPRRCSTKATPQKESSVLCPSGRHAMDSWGVVDPRYWTSDELRALLTNPWQIENMSRLVNEMRQLPRKIDLAEMGAADSQKCFNSFTDMVDCVYLLYESLIVLMGGEIEFDFDEVNQELNRITIRLAKLPSSVAPIIIEGPLNAGDGQTRVYENHSPEEGFQDGFAYEQWKVQWALPELCDSWCTHYCRQRQLPNTASTAAPPSASAAPASAAAELAGAEHDQPPIGLSIAWGATSACPAATYPAEAADSLMLAASASSASSSASASSASAEAASASSASSSASASSASTEVALSATPLAERSQLENWAHVEELAAVQGIDWLKIKCRSTTSGKNGQSISLGVDGTSARKICLTGEDQDAFAEFVAFVRDICQQLAHSIGTYKYPGACRDR